MEKIQDQDRLATLIHQWNQDHYDIFELSKPNENLEFHGVVRFYFQDGANVVTKCIRVASSATTKEVVDVLIEKFRPDMRMLTRNSYALYEVHVNGDERRLLDAEKVLFVQLNWGKDVREGRFLLKQEGVPTISPMENKENTGKTFTRKLSKREKKEKKRQDKTKQRDHGGGLAGKLYIDMPETKFTRSISNPEAVMKRRRQMKVEKKLQQCRVQDGQGGTLKIYGETLRPDVPYKTLLLSTGDSVDYVIKEALEKYDLDKEDPADFCLFQVLVPPGEREYHGGAIGQERVMESHECPLAIAMRFPPSEGTVMFQLKRRPADAKKTKHKKIRAVSAEDVRYAKEDRIPPNQLPYLKELNPDGSDNPKGKVYSLSMKFTEVGTDRNMLIQIHGPNVQPRHCVVGLTQSDGIVTVTPTSPESETIVNNQRIHETTTLRPGMTIRFGKLNVFKFMDPNFEEKMKKGQMPMEFQKRSGPQHPPHVNKVHETNFDVDGKVESLGSSSPRGSDRGPEPMEIQRRPPPNQTSPRDVVDGRSQGPPPTRQEDALPAVLEFREDKEDGFLRSVILDVNSSGTQFKLAPTYTSYMAVRYCISGGYRPDMSPHDRAHRVTGLVKKISHLVHQAVQNNRDNPVALALWMANASEILNFFKQDHDIHPFSLEAQEILAESVQLAFHHLVNCLQYDLQRTMTAFLDENDAADDDQMGDDGQRYNAGKPTLGDVLDTLSSAMNLLRRCRVNAALTIQLFSQLFHYVNMWLFNVLVTERRMQFCTRSWGMRLKRRLGRVEAWAEKQGLELAADCHLCRIIQAAHLLEAPKGSADDITNICSTCFKLNSLQLRELLQQYIPEPNEPPIPQNLIDQVVRVAENMEDEKIKSDGRDVHLEEDSDLQLPFLLPEDGYSCDTIRGIPNGLGEFVEPLARAGICRMISQPGSSGEWTVYMHFDEGANMDEAIRKNQPSQQQQQHGGPPPENKPQIPKEPEVVTITFNKVKGSMGLSIVAAKLGGQTAPLDWFGALNVTYMTGPGFSNSSLQLQLEVNNVFSQRNISNIIAVIDGKYEKDKYVIIGAHIDSWTKGAVDSGTGYSVIWELARGFGALINGGWRPRRTIMFALWDASKYGHIGSFEWVQEYEKMLGIGAVAYINLDSVIRGNYSFHAEANHLLFSIIKNATDKVPCTDPDYYDKSVYTMWLERFMDPGKPSQPKINPLNGDSDHTPFEYYLGVPSVSPMYTFNPKIYPHLPTYPAYSTLEDNKEYVEVFLDKDTKLQQTITKIVADMALQLADTAILPFDVQNYAQVFDRGKKFLREKASVIKSADVDLDVLYSKIDVFLEATQNFSPNLKNINLDKLTESDLTIINDKLLQLTRIFISYQGIPGYPQYRHLLLAPHVENLWDDQIFPGIAVTVDKCQDSNDCDDLRHQISLLIVSVHQATELINDEIFKKSMDL